MLTVWGRRTSSNVQSVMWTIAELGLAHERIDAGMRHGLNDTPEFLAMNPNGLIPVIRDGDDEPIFESGAIIRYLASRYGNAPFWPEDPSRRAQVDKWAEWAKVTFAPAFSGPIFSAVVRTLPEKRNMEAIATAVIALSRLLAMAERQLEKHAFLAGPQLTVADIQFGHLLYRYFTLEIRRPAFSGLDAYYRNLTARPAFSQHVMVSYEELRAK
jgi:glutathione S-transferase